MVMKDSRGRKLVAPDGGWGWFVVLGASVCNFSTRSLDPSFGLLFGDLLTSMHIETAGAAVIMSTMDATINFSGMFIGPLLKTYSYRKVALFGAILSVVGLILTASASSMTHILITYSIIRGLGIGLAWCSTVVALNSYFSKFRGQATGFSMAGTAVGFMLMPQAVQLLLESYNFSGAIYILSAMGLNAVVGAALFQPIKWHMKPMDIEVENLQVPPMNTVTKNDDGPDNLKIETDAMLPVRPKIEITSAEQFHGPDQHQGMPRNPSLSICSTNVAMGMARKRNESVFSSISSMDFSGSEFHIHTTSDSDDEETEAMKTHDMNIKSVLNKDTVLLKTSENNKNEQQLNVKTVKLRKEKKISYWKKIVQFMDLDLLKDPIYLNIVIGLSVFFIAELNFKMVIPFFMDDLGYSKSETAFCLSMMAVSDIITRVVLPSICDRINIKRRTIFVVSAILLGISRSIMAEQTEYIPLLSTIVVSGLFRGATMINSSLSISEYCTIEKLPAAFGLYMVVKGAFTVTVGPVIGVIRDVTGSYPICIHSQTLLIFLCCLAWGVEYIVRKYYYKNAKDVNKNDI